MQISMARAEAMSARRAYNGQRPRAPGTPWIPEPLFAANTPDPLLFHAGTVPEGTAAVAAPALPDPASGPPQAPALDLDTGMPVAARGKSPTPASVSPASTTAPPTDWSAIDLSAPTDEMVLDEWSDEEEARTLGAVPLPSRSQRGEM